MQQYVFLEPGKMLHATYPRSLAPTLKAATTTLKIRGEDTVTIRQVLNEVGLRAFISGTFSIPSSIRLKAPEDTAYNNEGSELENTLTYLPNAPMNFSGQSYHGYE